MEIKVAKTQIAFRRTKAFAWVWILEKNLRRKAATLILSIAFPQSDPSPRWKQIVEPVPGRFMHHLALDNIGDVDEEVQVWLRAAWNSAI